MRRPGFVLVVLACVLCATCTLARGNCELAARLQRALPATGNTVGGSALASFAQSFSKICTATSATGEGSWRPGDASLSVGGLDASSVEVWESVEMEMSADALRCLSFNATFAVRAVVSGELAGHHVGPTRVTAAASLVLPGPTPVDALGAAPLAWSGTLAGASASLVVASPDLWSPAGPVLAIPCSAAAPEVPEKELLARLVATVPATLHTRALAPSWGRAEPLAARFAMPEATAAAADAFWTHAEAWDTPVQLVLRAGTLSAPGTLYTLAHGSQVTMLAFADAGSVRVTHLVSTASDLVLSGGASAAWPLSVVLGTHALSPPPATLYALAQGMLMELRGAAGAGEASAAVVPGALFTASGAGTPVSESAHVDAGALTTAVRAAFAEIHAALPVHPLPAQTADVWTALAPTSEPAATALVAAYVATTPAPTVAGWWAHWAGTGGAQVSGSVPAVVTHVAASVGGTVVSQDTAVGLRIATSETQAPVAGWTALPASAAELVDTATAALCTAAKRAHGTLDGRCPTHANMTVDSASSSWDLLVQSEWQAGSSSALHATRVVVAWKAHVRVTVADPTSLLRSAVVAVGSDGRAALTQVVLADASLPRCQYSTSLGFASAAPLPWSSPETSLAAPVAALAHEVAAHAGNMTANPIAAIVSPWSAVEASTTWATTLGDGAWAGVVAGAAAPNTLGFSDALAASLSAALCARTSGPCAATADVAVDPASPSGDIRVAVHAVYADLHALGGCEAVVAGARASAGLALGQLSVPMIRTLRIEATVGMHGASVTHLSLLGAAAAAEVSLAVAVDGVGGTTGAGTTVALTLDLPGHAALTVTGGAVEVAAAAASLGAPSQLSVSLNLINGDGEVSVASPTGGVLGASHLTPSTILSTLRTFTVTQPTQMMSGVLNVHDPVLGGSYGALGGPALGAATGSLMRRAQKVPVAGDVVLASSSVSVCASAAQPSTRALASTFSVTVNGGSAGAVNATCTVTVPAGQRSAGATAAVAQASLWATCGEMAPFLSVVASFSSNASCATLRLVPTAPGVVRSLVLAPAPDATAIWPSTSWREQAWLRPAGTTLVDIATAVWHDASLALQVARVPASTGGCVPLGAASAFYPSTVPAVFVRPTGGLYLSAALEDATPTSPLAFADADDGVTVSLPGGRVASTPVLSLASEGDLGFVMGCMATPSGAVTATTLFPAGTLNTTRAETCRGACRTVFVTVEASVVARATHAQTTTRITRTMRVPNDAPIAAFLHQAWASVVSGTPLVATARYLAEMRGVPAQLALSVGAGATADGSAMWVPSLVHVTAHNRSMTGLVNPRATQPPMSRAVLRNASTTLGVATAVAGSGGSGKFGAAGVTVGTWEVATASHVRVGPANVSAWLPVGAVPVQSSALDGAWEVVRETGVSVDLGDGYAFPGFDVAPGLVLPRVSLGGSSRARAASGAAWTSGVQTPTVTVVADAASGSGQGLAQDEGSGETVITEIIRGLFSSTQAVCHASEEASAWLSKLLATAEAGASLPFTPVGSSIAHFAGEAEAALKQWTTEVCALANAAATLDRACGVFEKAVPEAWCRVSTLGSAGLLEVRIGFPWLKTWTPVPLHVASAGTLGVDMASTSAVLRVESGAQLRLGADINLVGGASVPLVALAADACGFDAFAGTDFAGSASARLGSESVGLADLTVSANLTLSAEGLPSAWAPKVVGSAALEGKLSFLEARAVCWVKMAVPDLAHPTVVTSDNVAQCEAGLKHVLSNLEALESELALILRDMGGLGSVFADLLDFLDGSMFDHLSGAQGPGLGLGWIGDLGHKLHLPLAHFGPRFQNSVVAALGHALSEIEHDPKSAGKDIKEALLSLIPQVVCDALPEGSVNGGQCPTGAGPWQFAVTLGKTIPLFSVRAPMSGSPGRHGWLTGSLDAGCAASLKVSMTVNFELSFTAATGFALVPGGATDVVLSGEGAIDLGTQPCAVEGTLGFVGADVSMAPALSFLRIPLKVVRSTGGGGTRGHVLLGTMAARLQRHGRRAAVSLPRPVDLSTPAWAATASYEATASVSSSLGGIFEIGLAGTANRLLDEQSSAVGALPYFAGSMVMTFDASFGGGTWVPPTTSFKVSDMHMCFGEALQNLVGELAAKWDSHIGHRAQEILTKLETPIKGTESVWGSAMTPIQILGYLSADGHAFKELEEALAVVEEMLTIVGDIEQLGIDIAKCSATVPMGAGNIKWDAGASFVPTAPTPAGGVHTTTNAAGYNAMWNKLVPAKTYGIQLHVSPSDLPSILMALLDGRPYAIVEVTFPPATYTVQEWWNFPIWYTPEISVGVGAGAGLTLAFPPIAYTTAGVANAMQTHQMGALLDGFAVAAGARFLDLDVWVGVDAEVSVCLAKAQAALTVKVEGWLETASINNGPWVSFAELWWLARRGGAVSYGDELLVDLSFDVRLCACIFHKCKTVWHKDIDVPLQETNAVQHAGPAAATTSGVVDGSLVHGSAAGMRVGASVGSGETAGLLLSYDAQSAGGVPRVAVALAGQTPGTTPLSRDIPGAGAVSVAGAGGVGGAVFQVAPTSIPVTVPVAPEMTVSVPGWTLGAYPVLSFSASGITFEATDTIPASEVQFAGACAGVLLRAPVRAHTLSFSGLPACAAGVSGVDLVAGTEVAVGGALAAYGGRGIALSGGVSSVSVSVTGAAAVAVSGSQVVAGPAGVTVGVPGATQAVSVVGAAEGVAYTVADVPADRAVAIRGGSGSDTVTVGDLNQLGAPLSATGGPGAANTLHVTIPLSEGDGEGTGVLITDGLASRSANKTVAFSQFQNRFVAIPTTGAVAASVSVTPISAGSLLSVGVTSTDDHPDATSDVLVSGTCDPASVVQVGLGTRGGNRVRITSQGRIGTCSVRVAGSPGVDEVLVDARNMTEGVVCTLVWPRLSCSSSAGVLETTVDAAVEAVRVLAPLNVSAMPASRVDVVSGRAGFAFALDARGGADRRNITVHVRGGSLHGMGVVVEGAVTMHVWPPASAGVVAHSGLGGINASLVLADNHESALVIHRGTRVARAGATLTDGCVSAALGGATAAPEAVAPAALPAWAQAHLVRRGWRSAPAHCQVWLAGGDAQRLALTLPLHADQVFFAGVNVSRVNVSVSVAASDGEAAVCWAGASSAYAEARFDVGSARLRMRAVLPAQGDVSVRGVSGGVPMPFLSVASVHTPAWRRVPGGLEAEIGGDGAVLRVEMGDDVQLWGDSVVPPLSSVGDACRVLWDGE